MRLRPATDKNLVLRKDGRRLRRVNLYLTPKTFERLRRHCFETGLDLSEVTEAAVARHLDAERGRNP